MNKILISSLLMLSVLSASMFIAVAQETSNARTEAMNALSRLARTESQRAAADVVTQSSSTISSTERMSRALLLGSWHSLVWGTQTLYTYPATTGILAAATGIWALIKYPQARLVATNALQTTASAVYNYLKYVVETAMTPAIKTTSTGTQLPEIEQPARRRHSIDF